MIRKYLVNTLLCLGVAQMLTAEEGNGVDCCYPITADQPVDPCCLNTVYPYPANFSPCNSWNVYAEGEFLYWGVGKDTTQGPTAFLAFDNNQFVLNPQKTSYRPGFKVALGVDMCSVVLNLSYLRYHSHTTDQYSARAGGGIIPFWSPPTGASLFAGAPRLFFQNATSSFRFDLDVGQISLQHPVYMGKRMIMNLSYGLLGVWMGDDWLLTAAAFANPLNPLVGITSSGSSRTINKSWAVGPSLGFNARGLLACNFQLIGDIQLSAQYSEQYKGDTFADFPNYRLNNQLIPVGNMRVCLDKNVPGYQIWHSGYLGLGWGDYFCCDRYHLNLAVGYNWVLQHSFVLLNTFSTTSMNFNQMHNMSVHGFNVSGRLDF